MNPTTVPESKTDKLNEIKQLKLKINSQVKTLNDERMKLYRQEKERQKSQATQRIDLDDLIDDQQNLLKEAEKAGDQSLNIFNRSIYQLQLSRDRSSEDVMSKQKVESQQFKRNRQAEQQEQKPTTKKVKTSQVNENNEKSEQRQKLFQQRQRQSHQQVQYEVNNSSEEKQFMGIGAYASQQQSQLHSHQMSNFQRRRQLNDQQRDIVQMDVQQQQVSQQPQQNDNPAIQASLQTAHFNNPPNNPDDQQPSQSQSSSENDQQQNSQLQDQDDQFDSSEYSSQEKYMISDTQLYLKFKQNMQNHPKKYRDSLFPLHVKYDTFTQKKIASIKKSKKVYIPPEAHFLFHLNVPVVMQNFIKYNWVNLIEITFTNCSLTNERFRTFVEHYTIYPNIKILYLSCNKRLTNVTEAMLARFKSLEYIFFGEDADTCHLSPESIVQIKKYEQSHPQVNVIYFDPSK